MALVPGDDPDSMREMELSTAETPVFDKTTEYTIQKKLEQWERATSRRASCEQRRSPSHGGGSDGDATASALAITFEGRKVPFNVYYWGEAVPVRLYRKTTPACPRCGTIGHRPDVCPNPQTGRCRACGETNLHEDHECQPSCLICGGPHLTGSIQCNQKYRRGGAGTGAGRKPVNGKASQQHQSKNSVTSQAPDLQARTPGETPSPRPHGRAFSGGPGGGGRPADKHDGPEPDPRRGNKTSSNKVSWADVVASPPLTLAEEKLRAENERLRLEIQKLREKTAANAPENCIASQVPSAQAMEEDNPPPPPSGSATKLPSRLHERVAPPENGGDAPALKEALETENFTLAPSRPTAGSGQRSSRTHSSVSQKITTWESVPTRDEGRLPEVPGGPTQLPVETTEASTRGPLLLCTVGPSLQEQSIPPDGICDQLFYTSVHVMRRTVHSVHDELGWLRFKEAMAAVSQPGTTGGLAFDVR
ncbi:hypothetical protein HPB49_004267 [Dermacentor silvarum]|uniref:Uncharacterized protein n=1 Tax=Dermacentor silvarum TaxID=543639 RepID=A0ACB8CUZ7_DERSI|nr:hypothetical protein HPB49_004267 [Dermacentor silvarum]